MSKRTLGRFVAQSELQMRRRQMIQPVPCWEYKWVAISSNSTVRLRQWVKTDKKQVIKSHLIRLWHSRHGFQGLEPSGERLGRHAVTRLSFTSVRESL